jgi:hypothetical protein
MGGAAGTGGEAVKKLDDVLAELEAKNSSTP